MTTSTSGLEIEDLLSIPALSLVKLYANAPTFRHCLRLTGQGSVSGINEQIMLALVMAKVRVPTTVEPGPIQAFET